jgi:hypothetical protein
MLLSPVVTGHCQGQLLSLWQNPVLLRLRGYHPLRQHVPEHFSSENSVLYAIAHHISTTLPWQIQFGLFRFRSPLLAESRVDFSSSSYSDASLRTVRPPKRKARECKERPHSEILGSKVACTYPKLIAACHVLHHLSSRVIPQPASLHLYQVHHFLLLQPRKFYANISVKPHFSTLSVDIVACFCDPLHDDHRGLPRCVLHPPFSWWTA